jgi:hypothetical protein
MRTALLIGAQTGGLNGVEHDVETMAGLLKPRGFQVHRCHDPTRDGILDGYERLIQNSAPGDSVVIFYSGHGGYAVAPGSAPVPAAARLPDLQFIVPTDFDESATGDFRGITALELSVRLAQLTAVTRNVTVILDCCHSSHMSRDPRLVPKALLHPSYLDVAEHNEAAKRAGLPADLPHAIGNPDAVRVVACAPWEVAYEYEGMNRHPIGMLTESFSVALTETGDVPVSWSLLIQRIRDRVQLLAPGQRPEVEGPAGRLLFDTTTADATGILPAVPADDGRVRLPGARLLGVRPGDKFAVVAATGPAEYSTVATATVNRIDGVTAEAEVVFQDGHSEIPTGARARLLRRGAPRRSVAVSGVGAVVEQVRAELAATPLLRPADPGDDMFAELVVGTELHLRDSVGPLTRPRLGDADGIATVIADLKRLARADMLRTFTPDADEALAEPFTLEWGRVIAGTRGPLGQSGEVVHAGERVYVRLVNDGDIDLFLTAFDLGIAGGVRIITNGDRSGLRVSPGHEQVVGRHQGGHLIGSALSWPAVPTGNPRQETIIVVVSSARQDLSALEQENVGNAADRAATERQMYGGSSLQRFVAQMALGTAREWENNPEPTVSFAVRRIDFTLSPEPAPIDETEPFLVDERPTRSVRLLAPRLRARGRIPPTVAVRLNELIVRRNRALGSADVRVDALVFTGGLDDKPAYRAQTARFSNVRDGQRLPMDNLLVYHGPAVDYLDLAWWVSRDRSDSLALSELLSHELNTENVRQSALQLTGMALTMPHAAAAVMAVGSTAVIVNTAYRLLSGVAGNSIGIYRTSLLSNENFGIGRHPASGLQDAQDFAFAYEVVLTT